MSQGEQKKPVQTQEQQKPQQVQQKKPQVKQEPEKKQQKSEFQKQFELHENQQKMIRQQMEAESPLIGDLFILSTLLNEFQQNAGFKIKIESLLNKYQLYRKTRRDGSCFYRALNFCIFEKIIQGNNKLRQHMLGKIKGAKEHLLQAKFEGLVFEDLQDLFIEKLSTKVPKSVEQILKMFRDPEESNYLVLFLRYLTSGSLKNNAILYETFIDQQMPIDVFCQLEVEPIDKQADQIQIMALLNYLEVAIKIIYLDGSMNKQPYTVILPESATEEQVIGELLYRPGHYDILYK